MKKKVEQKKEIIPIAEPGLFWEYKKHPQEFIDKADGFISSFAAELKALISVDKSLEENYQILAQKMGYNVHPSLKKKTKEASDYPALKNNDYGDRYAIFLNHKIDIITLKLFAFLISNFKITTLKLSSNQLEHEFDEVKRLLDREEFNTLYLEWNALTDVARRQELFVAGIKPNLQHLILRQCKMGNEIVKELLKKIKETPDSKLKSLDLYGNQLTNDISKDLSNFVQESKTIEFLGLSKNQINSEECLGRLFNSIGEIPLSEEEYEQHKLKEKSRDEVVERNKKRKKGAPQEPVPFVFEVKETGNGRCYVKNLSLKMLNLASNGIKESLAVLVRKFVENQGRQVELFIEGNKFSKTTRETFKFYENMSSSGSNNINDYIKIVSSDGFEFILETKLLPKSFPSTLNYPAKIIETIIQYLHYRCLNGKRNLNRLPNFVIEPDIALQLLKAASELGI